MALSGQELSISRSDLVNNFESSIGDSRLNRDVVHRHFIDSAESYLFDQYQVFLSAGKSGQLAYFVYDRKMWQAFLQATLMRMHTAGVNVLSDYRVAFVGTDDSRHTLKRTALCFPKRQVGIFGLQRPYEDFLEGVDTFKPDVLYGFSSAISLLAEAQLKGEIDIRPSYVFPGTDYLSEKGRVAIIEAWNKIPFLAYASTEGGLIAFECKHHHLHLNEDMVDICNIGSKSLLTNFVNQVQPYINYEIQDDIALSDAICECGLPYLTIEMMGRRHHSIIYVSGQGKEIPIHTILIRSAVDSIRRVVASESLLRAKNELLIKLWGDFDLRVAENSIFNALTKVAVNLDRVKISIEACPLQV